MFTFIMGSGDLFLHTTLFASSQKLPEADPSLTGGWRIDAIDDEANLAIVGTGGRVDVISDDAVTLNLSRIDRERVWEIGVRDLRIVPTLDQFAPFVGEGA